MIWFTRTPRTLERSFTEIGNGISILVFSFGTNWVFVWDFGPAGWLNRCRLPGLGLNFSEMFVSPPRPGPPAPPGFGRCLRRSSSPSVAYRSTSIGRRARPRIAVWASSFGRIGRTTGAMSSPSTGASVPPARMIVGRMTEGPWPRVGGRVDAAEEVGAATPGF